MYPVCPDRNVDAAFECFFGPDSGNLKRFSGDQRRHCMRMRGWQAGLARAFVLDWTAARHFIFSFSKPIALPK